jgi:hypothetical protein
MQSWQDGDTDWTDFADFVQPFGLMTAPVKLQNVNPW